MQVHQVKGDPTLQVTSYPVNLHLPTDVQDLAPRDIRFCNGLIHALVLLDPFPEIPFSLFLAHALVIGITRTSFERDVGSDDLWVVAPRFEKDALETGFSVDSLLDFRPLNTSFCLDPNCGSRDASDYHAYLLALVLLVASVQSTNQVTISESSFRKLPDLPLGLTMDPDISTLFQPSDQTLQTLGRQLFTKSRSLCVCA
jgi:hypothetical protein